MKNEDKVDPGNRVHLPFAGQCVSYEDQVKMIMNVLIRDAHKTAAEHDFWYDERSTGECIALMHSELSELLEACRSANLPSEKIPEFTKIEEEAADVIIRLFDWAGHQKLRLPEAIMAKMAYNKSRPKKHGKKF